MTSLDQMPKIFWIGELISIAIVITYVIYLFLHLKKSVDDSPSQKEQYKTNEKSMFNTPQKEVK